MEAVKRKVPEGSMTQRREAMESMVTAATAMVKAHENSGYFGLPEKYNEMAHQAREFIEWKKSREFKIEPRLPIEELI